MVSTAPRTQEDIGIAEVTPQRGDEVFGASQVGPFDYVPRVGFREYWYPGVWSKKVGRKPVNLKMLGDELVLFRGKDGNVVALNEWCPHRGARLSRGFCEFKGTVTCPYHGYTFDETGKCVAGLIETEDSPMVGKMRSRKYPTAEWRGIVFIWMGQTEPVPLDEDLPWEFKDSTLNDRRYTRVKDWEVNWTEPVNQGVDYHEFYLHRNVNFWRFVDWRLPFWRPKPVYTGGVKIVEEGDDFVTLHQKNVIFGEAEYPGLGKWPRKTWWRKLEVPRCPCLGLNSHCYGRGGLGHLQPQRRASQQGAGLRRHLCSHAMGRPFRRAQHPDVDIHPLQDPEDLPGPVLAGRLVLLLAQARGSSRHQRKRGPGGLQEGTPQPRRPSEAIGARHRRDTVPQPPGPALP